MITLRELVEQQKAAQEEQCFVEENEDIDGEMDPEELAELELLVDQSPGGQGWYAALEQYPGRYDSGTMQKARVPKYGPGKVRKDGQCLY